MMTPQLLTAPAKYPVSLAEARFQLGLQTQDFDPRLAGLIAAATSAVETFLNRSLISRSYHGFLDYWPVTGQAIRGDSAPNYGAGYPFGGGEIGLGFFKRALHLPRPPLISVDYVKTYDDTDTATTFDPSNYYVDTAGNEGRLVLRTNSSWTLPTRTANGIEIGWTAGYGVNPADVPEPIRLAIQMMVGSFNEQRGDESAPPTIPPAAQALLWPYRITPA